MFLQHPCFIINNILLKTFVINSTLLLFLMVNPLYSQTFNQVYKALASDRENGDWFGCSVSISGDYAIAGAEHNSNDTSGLDSLYHRRARPARARCARERRPQGRGVRQARALGRRRARDLRPA